MRAGIDAIGFALVAFNTQSLYYYPRRTGRASSLSEVT